METPNGTPKKAALVIDFDYADQTGLVDSLARQFGYPEKVRHALEGGGYETITNPQSKEEYVVSRYRNLITTHYKRGYTELEADKARAKAEEAVKNL